MSSTLKQVKIPVVFDDLTIARLDLKSLRTKLNLSMTELSRRLGASTGHLSRIESGRSKLTDNMRKRLRREFLGLGMDREVL